MPRKIDYSQFVADRIYHKRGRFRYNKASFDNDKKMAIECLKHGLFYQTCTNHTGRGAGCPQCAGENTGRRCSLSKVEIGRKLIESLSGRDYEIVSIPESMDGDVWLKCLKHNQEYSLPIKSVLHSGCVGCRVCRGEFTDEEVVSDMFLLSKGKFKIRIKGSTVEGWCLKHGKFSAQKSNLLKGGWGCPKCSKEEAGRKHHMNNGITLEQATADLFNNIKGKYRKIKAVKKGFDIVFHLSCPIHGVFELSWLSSIKPNSGGFGCPECSIAFKAVKAARSRVKSSEKSFIARAAERNPQLMVVGEYRGVNELIDVKCGKGHITSIPANRLLEGRSSARCETCYGVTGSSQPEEKISALLHEFRIEFERKNRKLLGGKELDFYLPEHNMAIEYDGAIWHSEKYQTKRTASNDKRIACREKGIRLLTVCSSMPVKAYMGIIASAVGIDEERYQARMCKVVVVDSNDSRLCKLLTDKHFQGRPKGCRWLGLEYRGSLVAVMGFSHINSERGSKRDNSRWELRRYASYGRVVGGASKLLTAFIRSNPECVELISYSDNRLFMGGLYKALGFVLVKESPPDYRYTRNGQHTLHKSLFKRSLLATKPGFDFDPMKSERENCWDNGWYRVWDCGKKKWKLRV